MNSADEPSRLSDFDWDAFRYVAGEMSADEVCAFEQILSDNVDACAAVAQATQLSLAARTVMDDQSQTGLQPRGIAEGRPATRWTAAVVAFAAMSLMLALLYLPDSTPKTVDRTESSAAELNDLQAAAELISRWSSSPVPATEEIVSDVPDTFSGAQEAAAGAEIVPSWLMAAVSLETAPAEEMMDESPAPPSEL